jgi:hypothetical protein
VRRESRAAFPVDGVFIRVVIAVPIDETVRSGCIDQTATRSRVDILIRCQRYRRIERDDM